MNLSKSKVIDHILQKQITQSFKEAVRLHPTCNSELKKVLLKEPKNNFVTQYLEKLTIEFQLVNDLRLKQGKGLATSKHVKELVYDMTNYFIYSMDLHAERRAESDLARMARQESLDKFKDMDSTADGKPLGEFAEAGVFLDETRNTKGQAAQKENEKG